MPDKKVSKGRVAGVKRRRKAAGRAVPLAATDLEQPKCPEEITELRRKVEEDDGKVLCCYRDPYGGNWVLLVALPIEQIDATPFQRDISDSHVRKLETVIAKLGRFLDPIIVVRAKDVAKNGVKKYWTPNGHHRLSAMRTLGAKSITAILVPEAAIAYQILALNTEKAHNLREKALEVARMYRELASLGDGTEESYSLEFEEPAFITLGLCYEERPRFSGGAYHPILRRADRFLAQPLAKALEVRKKRARALLDLDDIVTRQVEALKKRGLTSPYLKSFVVARINPLRFRPAGAEPLSFDDVLERMTKAAQKFNPDKIKMEDLARSGGPPDSAD